MKKGQVLTLNTIIISAIVLMVLAVLFAIFTGKLSSTETYCKISPDDCVCEERWIPDNLTIENNRLCSEINKIFLERGIEEVDCYLSFTEEENGCFKFRKKTFCEKCLDKEYWIGKCKDKCVCDKYNCIYDIRVKVDDKWECALANINCIKAHEIPKTMRREYSASR